VPLPAWLAVMLQLPTLSSVSVVPLAVHTPVVAEAKVTVSPEVVPADSAAGVVPSV